MFRNINSSNKQGKIIVLIFLLSFLAIVIFPPGEIYAISVGGGIKPSFPTANNNTGQGIPSQAPIKTNITHAKARTVITPQGLPNPSSTSSEANNTGELTVITTNYNKCKPQSSCADIVDFYPSVSVVKFQDNQISSFAQFPGSQEGRTLNFFIPPQGIQYQVQQPKFPFQEAAAGSAVNATSDTSSDCEGVIHAKDQINCYIDNTIFSKENPLGQLKVISHNVINNCKPQSSCAKIVDFLGHSGRGWVSIHTFQNNIYSPFAGFPGSQVGRIVDFHNTILHVNEPDFGIQYDVSQDTLSPETSIQVTTHTSSDCQGVIHLLDNKVCMIDTFVNNPVSNSTLARQTSQPSNITSASK